MPLYDLECKDCGLVEERILKYSERDMQYCKVCGAPLHVVWHKGHRFIPFVPRLFNGFPGEHNRDVLVESKKQLKQLCKEHDCTSVYLADS